MPNKWLAHVKKTMKQMKTKGTYEKGKGLKQVIMAAKKTWSKVKKGGAEDSSDDEAAPVDKPDAAPVDKPAAAPAMGMGGRRKTRRRRHSRRR
jgi:hypothetical protein